MSVNQTHRAQHTCDRADELVDSDASATFFANETASGLRLDAGTVHIKRPHGAVALTEARRSEAPPSEVAYESLEEFVCRHGQYFDSYLATEPGRWNFWSRSRRGLISCALSGPNVLCGGGLIAPADHREELLGEFIESAAHQKLHVVFFNISDEAVPIFRKFGFQATKWGEEPVVDLGHCTWSGKSFEWVRRQTNFCLRQGLAASEVRPDQLDPQQWSSTMEELLVVSADSLSRKAQAAPMTFFEGQIENHELGLRRLFVARSEYGAGRIEAFVVCNPMHHGTSWATELYRRRPDSVRGTMAFLFHYLLNQMQSEGIRQVGLCLDPGQGCAQRTPGDSSLVHRSMQFGNRYLSFLFDIAGQRHFKSRFRPRYESRYVCSWPKSTIGGYVAFAKVSGLFNISLKKLASACLDRLRKRGARKTLSSMD